MRKLIFGLAAVTVAATPFSALAFPKDDGYSHRANYLDRYDRSPPCETVYDRRYDRYVCVDYPAPGHITERTRYVEVAEPERRDTWRDEDGRLRCRRSDGTTGLIVGAGTGALLGREIDSGGERTTGAIIGGIAGALIGRQLERGSCR